MPRIKTKSIEDEEGNIISFIDGDETKITSVTDKSGNCVQYSGDTSLKIQFADGNSYKESMNGRQRVQEIYNKAENTITTYRDGKLAHLSEKGEDFYFSFNEDGKVNSFKTSYGTVVCEDGKPHHFKAKGKEFHCENFEVYSEEFEFGKHYYDVNTGDLLRTDFAEGVKSYHVPFSFDDDRDIWKAWADEKIGAKGTIDYSIPRLEDFEAKVAKVEQVTQAAALKFQSERVATKAALKAQAAASKETVSLVELMTLETGRNISGDPRGTWEKVAALSDKYDFYELQKKYPIERMADELQTSVELAEKRGETVTMESLEENIKKLAEKHNVPLEFTDKELPLGKTVHIVQDEAVGCYSNDATIRASQRSRVINDKILQYKRMGVKCGVSLDNAQIEWKEPILSGNGETVLQKLGADGQVKRAVNESGTVFFYEDKANGEGKYLRQVLDENAETYLRENGTKEREHFLRCGYDEPEEVFYREDETLEKEIISGSGEQHYYDKEGKNIVRAETEKGKLIFTVDENKTKTVYYPDGETVRSVNYADGSRKVYGKNVFAQAVNGVSEDASKELTVVDKEGNKTVYKGWTEDEVISTEDVKGNKKNYKDNVLTHEYDAESGTTREFYEDGKTVKSASRKGKTVYYSRENKALYATDIYGTINGTAGTVAGLEDDGKTVAWRATQSHGEFNFATDTNGNQVFYEGGEVTKTVDAMGNETKYIGADEKICFHSELGHVKHSKDGTFSIFIDEGNVFGDVVYDKNGKLLSYTDKMGYNTVYFKEDGKTVDRIVGPQYEDGKLVNAEVNIDINSEQGKAIVKGFDEAVEKRVPQIQEYLQSEKAVQEFQARMQTEFKRYQADIVEGGISKARAKGTEQVVAKEAEKQAEQAVTSATEKAATKSAMKATAAKAGEKVAKTAKTAGKVAKETLLAANKAYDDTFDAIMKWGDKHAPQWMNKVEEKTVQKAADAFMKTKSGQAIAKQIEKKVGKEVAASIAKKIPILCLGVGAVCVYNRVKEGEYLKAVGEGASAFVANVPGLGTLASFGLDGAMLSDDLKVFEHGVMPKDPNSHVAAESTFVAQQIVTEKKFVRKVDKAAEAKKKAEEEKKKAESKKKAQEFEKNLYKYGGNPSKDSWGR